MLITADPRENAMESSGREDLAVKEHDGEFREEYCWLVEFSREDGVVMWMEGADECGW